MVLGGGERCKGECEGEGEEGEEWGEWCILWLDCEEEWVWFCDIGKKWLMIWKCREEVDGVILKWMKIWEVLWIRIGRGVFGVLRRWKGKWFLKKCIVLLK